MNQQIIYTIGHSTHTADYFAKLLQAYRVNCLVDVRSIAASRYNPQYNQKALSDFLIVYRITYLHFAAEFGARQTGALDERGRVDFEQVRQLPTFRNGIQRLLQGAARGYVIALMCAESDPLDCHRFAMITPALVEAGFEVRHILKDKTWLANHALEDRLLKKYDKKLPKPDVFHAEMLRAERLKLALRLRNDEVGWKIEG